MARPGNLSAGVTTFNRMVSGKTGHSGSIGALKGISVGGPTTWDGTGTFGRHLNPGISRAAAVGNPTAPSLAVAGPGFWRFRWALATGTHSVSFLVLQASGLSPRPSMVIKSNSDIGIVSDVTLTASVGTGWTVVGPVSVTVSSNGVTWVELHNNLHDIYDTAYFDHIVFT